MAAPIASIPAAAQPDRVVITDVRADAHGTRLRLAVTLGHRVPFDVFTLGNPRRLVIDLPQVDWRAQALSLDPHWITGARHGLYRPGTGRLVFDLARPVAIARAFTQPAAPGRAPRLVLDLVPTDDQSFADATATDRGTWATPRKPGLIVALDPGHGGRDPGAITEDLVEKDLVLSLARDLAAAIDARPGMSAVLTRADDSYVPLIERIDRARGAGADLMLSIHADQLRKGELQGLSVYSLGTGPAVTPRLVRGGDRASLINGSDLAGESDDVASLLVDLARRETGPSSERLASSLLAAADGRVPLLTRRPHRHGAYTVLKAADLPAVLIEIGFMDNAADRRRFQSRQWRQHLSDTLVRGIENWAAKPKTIN